MLFEDYFKNFPGPTAYDVSHAHDALVKQSRKPPRSKQAQLRQSQFLSTAKRTYANEIANDTPGPGAYDGVITPRLHGYATMREARFQSDTSYRPGPADYEVIDRSRTSRSFIEFLVAFL
jgi:hypothetical protein